MKLPGTPLTIAAAWLWVFSFAGCGPSSLVLEGSEDEGTQEWGLVSIGNEYRSRVSDDRFSRGDGALVAPSEVLVCAARSSRREWREGVTRVDACLPPTPPESTPPTP